MYWQGAGGTVLAAGIWGAPYWRQGRGSIVPARVYIYPLAGTDKGKKVLVT